MGREQMRPVQTRENSPRDSCILGAVGIDNVSELWHNSAKVHGMFEKTGVFQRNGLALVVKTKTPPPGLASERGLTKGIGGARG